MKTIEIFAEAVKFASEASDIPSDRILSESRDADVVDARMLVIQTLYDIGLYPRRIAELFRMTPSNVRHLLTADNRKATNKVYANNLQALRKHIASILKSIFMESKTYVFGENGNNGMMSLLAPLMQKSGLDPNLLLAMNRNNGGFGGEGDRFLWVIFLFFLMGWGGNGWGFGRNNSGGIANEINNDYGRSLLMDAIGGNRNALSNLATQLNCTEGQIQSAIAALTSQVQSVGNQVGMSGMHVINALQQGNMQIAQQIASCCCENRLATCQQTNTLQGAINNVAVGQERGFSSVAYETQRQTCDIEKSIKEATDKIVAGQAAAEMREM